MIGLENLTFCQISNLLGIFPAILAFQHRLYVLGTVMLLGMSLSIYYHHDESNEIAFLMDVGGCTLLASYMFYILMNAETNLTYVNILTLFYNAMALIFFVAAGEPGDEDYELYHTAWHVFVFYAASTFVYSYINTTLEKNHKSTLCRTIPIKLNTKLVMFR